MTALSKHKMTVDEFLAWSAGQLGRWELFDGLPVAIRTNGSAMASCNTRVARALDAAIENAGVPCRFVLDSAAVRIDAHRSFSPMR